MKSLLAVILFGFSQALIAQIIPAAPQSAPVTVVGATIHVGDGTTVIENGAVSFAGGLITYVGPRTGVPTTAGQTVIDATGKHVYPGFIAMDTRLGLLEIEAVRSTDDIAEVGYFNPNARALVAFNSDSEILPTVRNLGVLIAQVSPGGRGLAGQSSAMYLDGWNYEGSVIGADEGMHLHWPNAYSQSGWWAEPGGIRKNKDYGADVEKLNSYFAQAKAYQASAKTKDNVDNPRFRSMERVFTKGQTLYIHATYPREIEDALAFGERYGAKVVLVNARDAYLVKELLREKQISVVCGPVHALPERADDLVSQPFETPAELQQAGIDIAFSLSGAWEQRRVPYHAGHAVGFGLPYEQAVKGLTLTPATMMGIADKVGTLVTGKHATLFVSDGDALDMRTAVLTHAYIQGREIDLSSKQTKLAAKYREKYARSKR